MQNASTLIHKEMHMKCRVTFEYTEEEALAVAHHYGSDKPASHEEMRKWFCAYGESATDDIVDELREAKASEGHVK